MNLARVIERSKISKSNKILFLSIWVGLCFLHYDWLGFDWFVFGMVSFPLPPPRQGLKIIVWLSRRWGLHLLREPAQATPQR